MLKFLVKGCLFILAGGLLSYSPAAAQTAGTTPRYAQSDALRAPNGINERPRYGGMTKTAAQREADARFVAEARQQYGSAQAAMQAHVNFGWHYLATGHAPTAIKRFNQAWLLDSTAADVYFGFSAYLRQTNQLVEAAQFEQLAGRHDSGNAARLRYYASLGYGQSLRRDYVGAIAANEQILALDPTNASALGRIGYFAMQQQDTARAGQYLSRAVALNPQDSVAYLNRGWVRYGQKRYPAAVADFTRALSINPRYVSAYANRALAYSEAGNYPAAIADWQTCLSLVSSRDRTQFYFLIGQAKTKINDPAGPVKLGAKP
ncbi:tetratricopeptide repeat protein [Hymenobacter cellulosilyticus]|uniref:Tetratricopeptide repeat protein n=1 Tax=Hymenobacter cellulosilyticus TaxID=2932248 RepID=A0A8T9Q0U6_9BACT|nr:tetratricopeptide repeat protein [Hymenobacter cellulosilyticus]UOQ71007.1 tetratricopeptide repeat protein [Hymenobacter cellulosilyticus]